MGAKKEMLNKRLKVVEATYVTKASKLKKMTKTSDKYDAESGRLRRKIKILEASNSKIKGAAMTEQREAAALAKKMESTESALSPEQLKAKELEAEQKLTELRKDASDKGAKAEELQPGWG